MSSTGIKLTKNFPLYEFKCTNGVWVPEEYIENVQELADNLQVLRDFINVPIYINSGYRTEEYNKKISGSKNSQHLYAKAADIRAKNINPVCLHTIIEGLILLGKMKQGGLGLYDSFVHYDIRGTRARWNFRFLT
jgi:uncharacterized protein YcbK (DUF882 family)